MAGVLGTVPPQAVGAVTNTVSGKGAARVGRPCSTELQPSIDADTLPRPCGAWWPQVQVQTLLSMLVSVAHFLGVWGHAPDTSSREGVA